MSQDVPVTVWQPTSGNGEYSFLGVYNIDDPSGNLLVDPSAVQIVDTGVIFTQIPSSIWAENDGE